MGQKVNPHGLRVGVIKNWDSRWFANDSVFGDILVEDYNLRKYLKKTLFSAGIAKIEIERDDKRVRLHIHCAKPGMVIGRNGSEIEKLRATCQQMLGKPVVINIVEIRKGYFLPCEMKKDSLVFKESRGRFDGNYFSLKDFTNFHFI